MKIFRYILVAIISLLFQKCKKHRRKERRKRNGKREERLKERRKRKKKKVQSKQCVSRGKLGIDLSFD